MGTPLYCVILAAVFCAQLALNLTVRRRVIKCIPAMVILALVLLSFLGYWCSGWRNWGWLILMLLEAGALVPAALAATIGGIARRNRKESFRKGAE